MIKNISNKIILTIIFAITIIICPSTQQIMANDTTSEQNIQEIEINMLTTHLEDVKNNLQNIISTTTNIVTANIDIDSNIETSDIIENNMSIDITKLDIEAIINNAKPLIPTSIQELPESNIPWNNHDEYIKFADGSYSVNYFEYINNKNTNFATITTWIANGKEKIGVIYKQRNDELWGNLPLYASGNSGSTYSEYKMSGNGCQPTSVASALSSTTLTYINPAETAVWFMQNGGIAKTSQGIAGYGKEYVANCVNAYAEEYDVYAEVIYGDEYTLYAKMKEILPNSNTFIIGCGGNSQKPIPWRTSGHFVCFADYDIESDTFFVIDSNGSENDVIRYPANELLTGSMRNYMIIIGQQNN